MTNSPDADAGGAFIAYTYTPSGQLDTVTDSRGTTRYGYDGEGRLTGVTNPDGTTMAYTYDALGRKTSVTVPSGETTYDYDQFNRLISVKDPDGNETRYTYDSRGNKSSVIYPNGVITVYGYDNLNRLTYVEHRTLTGTILGPYTYTLNAKGQRTRVEEQPTGRSVEYTYDEGDRLIAERITDPVLGTRVISYTYDPVGNRLTKNDNGVITNYTYDANDRLITENGFTYTYDNNGNMLSKVGNGETSYFTYNLLNQLVHAEMTTVDYTYDHDGIRVGKTINGTDVTRYLVDKNLPTRSIGPDGRGETTTYDAGPDGSPPKRMPTAALCSMNMMREAMSRRPPMRMARGLKTRMTP